MTIVITAGQRGDSPQFEPVLNKVRADCGIRGDVPVRSKFQDPTRSHPPYN